MYNYNIFALYMCGKILSTACDFYARFWANRLKDIVFCLHFSIFNAVVSLSKCARRCIFVPLEKAVEIA